MQPNGRGYESLLESAEQMVALVAQAEAEREPRRPRVGRDSLAEEDDA